MYNMESQSLISVANMKGLILNLNESGTVIVGEFI